MKLKLRRIAVVLTAALPLAAATIPTKAEAFGFLLAPALLGSALLGSGAFGGGGYAYGGGYGGGGYAYGGDGCCRQVRPPPPPPCCYYGRGRGDWDGGW